MPRKPGKYRWFDKDLVVEFTGLCKGTAVKAGNDTNYTVGYFYDAWTDYTDKRWIPVSSSDDGLKLTLPKPKELSDTDRLEAKLDKLIVLLSKKKEMEL